MRFHLVICQFESLQSFISVKCLRNYVGNVVVGQVKLYHDFQISERFDMYFLSIKISLV